jgi:hypothetical protein
MLYYLPQKEIQLGLQLISYIKVHPIDMPLYISVKVVGRFKGLFAKMDMKEPVSYAALGLALGQSV